MATENNNNSKNNSFLDRIKKKNSDSDSDSDEGSSFMKKHDKGESDFATRYQKKPAMTSAKLGDVSEDGNSTSEKKTYRS